MVRSMCSEIPDGSTSSNMNIDVQELAPILKSIIVTRSKEGATIEEIVGDFCEFTGDNLLSLCRDRDSIANVLRKVDGIWCSYSSPDGPCLWYCSTQNTKHLTEMIKKQKSPRFQNRQYQAPSQPISYYQKMPTTSSYSQQTPVPSTSGTGPRDKFYSDNINFIPKRNIWNRTQQRSGSNHPYWGAPQWRPVQQVKPTNRKPMYPPMMRSNYYSNNAKQFGPTFCGFQMIGDDFFLSLARWELGFLFDPGHGVQRSGLCISGLTIAEAADRVMKATYINDRVMVNVGVVDLLHGADLIDMQQDLLQLMKNLEIRGATVILTTLSPLANGSHISYINDRLHKFNDIIRKCPHVDVWRCFVNERSQTLYECFQPGPRQVSGSRQPHVLWNKLGRQRVIKFIKTELSRLI